MRTFMPFHYETIFILLLVTFAKYAEIRANFLQKQQEKKNKKKDQGPSMIDSSQMAYEEALHDDGFSSSATESQASGNNKSEASNQEEGEKLHKTEIKDETLRGRFYSFFQVFWQGIKWTLDKGRNISTVHSTKIALAILFCVTVFSAENTHSDFKLATSTTKTILAR